MQHRVQHGTAHGKQHTGRVIFVRTKKKHSFKPLDRHPSARVSHLTLCSVHTPSSARKQHTTRSSVLARSFNTSPQMFSVCSATVAAIFLFSVRRADDDDDGDALDDDDDALCDSDGAPGSSDSSPTRVSGSEMTGGSHGDGPRTVIAAKVVGEERSSTPVGSGGCVGKGVRNGLQIGLAKIRTVTRDADSDAGRSLAQRPDRTHTIHGTPLLYAVPLYEQSVCHSPCWKVKSMGLPIRRFTFHVASNQTFPKATLSREL